MRDPLELLHLIVLNCDGSHGSEHPLRHRVTVEGGGKGEHLFPDLRCKPQHTHNLGYPGAGDPLLRGNIRLSGNLSGFQESFPLDGFSEEFDDPGRLGHLRRFGVAPAG